MNGEPNSIATVTSMTPPTTMATGQTTTSGNRCVSPISLATTLKEHQGLVADYHHQLQRLQNQHIREQQKQLEQREERSKKESRRGKGPGPSPPDSPFQDDDPTSDMDEFMGSEEDDEDDDEVTGVALDLVSLVVGGCLMV